MPGVFLCYRRAGSGIAGRLYDRLTARLTERFVFRDINSIDGGQDFTEVIKWRISTSDVLIAIIDTEWGTAKDETGRRRLATKRDFVRLELSWALGNDVPIIPVLVDGARMPQAADLPEAMKHLARHHALELVECEFDAAFERLIARIRQIMTDGIAPDVLHPVAFVEAEHGTTSALRDVLMPEVSGVGTKGYRCIGERRIYRGIPAQAKQMIHRTAEFLRSNYYRVEKESYGAEAAVLIATRYGGLWKLIAPKRFRIEVRVVSRARETIVHIELSDPTNLIGGDWDLPFKLAFRLFVSSRIPVNIFDGLWAVIEADVRYSLASVVKS